MTTVAVPAVQRRVLLTLACAQALAGIGSAAALAVSSLIAARLSGSDAVGGTALTAVVLGAACAALLVSRVASRAGRRPALTLGYGGGAAGAAGAVASVASGSVAGLLVSLFVVGAATAAGLAARFAATDLAEPGRRARSLALVVWATTLGAVTGPNLAGPVQTLAGAAGLIPATGPYLLCALVFGLAAAGTWVGLRPDPLLLARSGEQTASGAPAPVHGAAVRAAIRRSPVALLGAGGVVLGHLVMVGLMSMTPVHMDQGGATLQVVGLVISVHVAGMYAFSPVFGRLADVLGGIRVLVLGGVLLLAAGGLCAVAGPAQVGLLGLGLFVLGLGWSACLVAGSTLVTESVPLALRARAQGLVDVGMNISGGLGGIAAGLIVTAGSFAVLGLSAAVLAAPYLFVATGLAVRHRMPSADI